MLLTVGVRSSWVSQQTFTLPLLAGARTSTAHGRLMASTIFVSARTHPWAHGVSIPAAPPPSRSSSCSPRGPSRAPEWTATTWAPPARSRRR
uniref:Uncharacterized protein n=1 Tax=Aegilops tauschii subsp. strangulata TaxID=200361 RepID=A0A453CJH8_AEGTS